jgi:hypothetical protein
MMLLKCPAGVPNLCQGSTQEKRIKKEQRIKAERSEKKIIRCNMSVNGGFFLKQKGCGKER